MTESKKVTSLLIVPMEDSEESIAHINSIRALLHKHAASIGKVVREQVINVNDETRVTEIRNNCDKKDNTNTEQ
jgi:hypothetical protein